MMSHIPPPKRAGDKDLHTGSLSGNVILRGRSKGQESKIKEGKLT